MILIPPIQIQQGLPITSNIVWEEDDVPVNMSSGWTGAVTFKRQVGDDSTLLTVTPTLGASGEIDFSLTATQTLALPALDKRGPFATCIYQIKVQNATTGQVFQGDAVVSALL
jgi:hypothetical protein